MADRVCSKCNVDWQILKHDRFCGYCGCEAFGFSVRWEGNPLFYVGDETDTRELEIHVENTGATEITFEPLQIDSGGALTLSDTDKSFTVQPGKTHTAEVHVDTKTESQEKVSVRAKNAAPNPDNLKLLELQILPLPEFTLKPKQVSLEYPESRETETVDFNIESQQDSFHIEGIDSSQEWINDVDLSKAPESVRLEINCNQLKEGHNSKTLRFKLRGPSKPIEKKIQIQTKILPEPPTLFVMPEENLEIIQDRETSHIIRLENKGEDPLTIKNIVLDDSSGLVQLPDLEFPIIIEGRKEDEKEAGKHREVGVSISSVNILPGIYPINFTIISNCDTVPVYQYTLNVTVNQREKYPHYLAIDFGTTNSCCCVYIEKDDELKPLPLDSEADPPNIMPSSIIYRSHPKNEKFYDVGYDAETDRTSRDDGPYYISSVKRWLGFEWRRQFPNNQEWQPYDVVSHILKHIITKAEDYLEQQGIPSKITRCVITHPTIFTPKQRADLEQAFENIGISELILIDEASAASIGTIFAEERYGTPQTDYRLLVYDFGGGTIDIVLSQVTSDNNNTTIEPIARGGNPRYGGDDVTQAIVDFVWKEYKRRIQQAHPNLNFDIPYFKPRNIWQPTGDSKIDEATRRNAAILYRRAEEMKKELNTQQETEFFAPLDVVIENDVNTLQELTQDFSSVKLSREQFQHFIAPALNDTFTDIDKMIADNDEHLPDTVILAGQSSKTQLVKDMLAAHFQDKYQTNIEIRLDKDPKTCVVMGAANYSLIDSLSDEEDRGFKVVNLANKTVSRLGITRRRGIKRVFGEIIPKGKLIPEESVNTVTYKLNSVTPRIMVREHFGLDDDLKNTSEIASYTADLPKDVSPQALSEARLKMAVKANGKIELTVIVDGKEHKSIVEKQKPEFVDEIPQTESAIETGNVRALNVYQQEAEGVVRNAREQVSELARAYKDGKPIDLEDI